jgi:hypothetical protein
MARVNLQSPMQHEGWVDGEWTRNIFPLDFNSLANNKWLAHLYCGVYYLPIDGPPALNPLTNHLHTSITK